MPNWCSSDLTVTAKPKDKIERKKFPNIIVKFMNDMSGEWSCLDMNKVIPYPHEYAEADKKAHEIRKKWEMLSKEEREKTEYPKVKDGFNNGGYDWCVRNWGVKWNFCEAKLVSEEKLKLKYEFETPWSPPLPIILKMSEMFPELEFKLKYYEAGMGFQGTFIAKGGTIEKHESKDYNGGRGG